MTGLFHWIDSDVLIGVLAYVIVVLGICRMFAINAEHKRRLAREDEHNPYQNGDSV